MSPIKRKIRISSLSVENSKRVKPDPAPVLADASITDYADRTQQLLPADREQLHLLVPCQEYIDERIKEEVQTLSKKQRAPRLRMFTTNIVIELARHLNKEFEKGHDLTNDTLKLK